MPEDNIKTNQSTQIKGRNPHFFDDPNTDRLLTMIMELASEVSVLRDRLDTNERLAANKGLYTDAEIESYRPSDEEAAQRSAWRSRFLDRLLKGLYATFDSGPNTAEKEPSDKN